MKKHVYFLTLLFAVISFCFVNCGGGDGSDTGPQLNQNCETIDTIDGPMVICEDSCQSDEDKDCDDVKDSEDNCPDIFNPSQTDTDGDKIGDSCDNCPENDNTFQSDYDMDGIGDECDDDADGDGIENSSDNCDLVYNPDQANEDGDSCGDVCDDQKTDPTICIDTDKDGITDADDNCPTVANGPLAAETPGDNQDNTDAKFGDTEGNACDDDDDNDGILDVNDNCPYCASTDNSCTLTDTDGDGVCDDQDNCVADANVGQQDKDGDGLGDICDPDPENPDLTVDSDGDGIPDAEDNCPEVNSTDQSDLDGDGLGKPCDQDADGDHLRDKDKGSYGPTLDNDNGTKKQTVWLVDPIDGEMLTAFIAGTYRFVEGTKVENRIISNNAKYTFLIAAIPATPVDTPDVLRLPGIYVDGLLKSYELSVYKSCPAPDWTGKVGVCILEEAEMRTPVF